MIWIIIIVIALAFLYMISSSNNKTDSFSSQGVLSFDFNEMSVIYKLAFLVIGVDGDYAPQEMKLVAEELGKLGVTSGKLQLVSCRAKEITSTDAKATIAKMTYPQKVYVVALLITLALSDGKIEEKESALISLFVHDYGLPQISNEEAIRIIKNMSIDEFVDKVILK